MNQLPISLALSGGGVRASIFHLGVLRCFAELNLLEGIEELSTVSGGSLITGAIFSINNHKWPSSQDFLRQTYPNLRRILTSVDLLSFRSALQPDRIRWVYLAIGRRAEMLAKNLASVWGIHGVLSDLPSRPIWYINTTCIETGKNWRFSKAEMGDWIFGRQYAPAVSIADASAASAAVPYAIGALRLSITPHGWYRTDPATKSPMGTIAPPTHRVRLWDGGAYENLGLEAIYKPGKAGEQEKLIICSDASAVLRPTYVASRRRGLWSPRLFDVASDQIRSLRLRTFISDLDAGRAQGAVLRLGRSVRDLDISMGTATSFEDYNEFLSDARAHAVAEYPTHLCAVSPEDFDDISRNGYETARVIFKRRLQYPLH